MCLFDCPHSFDKMLDIAKDVVPVSIARIPMEIVGTGFREHLRKRIREHTCPQGVNGRWPTLMMVNACALVTQCAVEVCSFREGVERRVTGNLDPQDIIISKMSRLDARQKICFTEN